MEWLKKRLSEPSSHAALSAFFTLATVLSGQPAVGALGQAVLTAGNTYQQTGSKAAAIGAVVTGVAAFVLKEKGNTNVKN